jgi:homoserine O-acetyltransferase
MDMHDPARDRIVLRDTITFLTPLEQAASFTRLPPCALVVSIKMDGLSTTTEQQELAAHIPDAELVFIPSPDGHDGFLLEYEQINGHLLRFLRREFPLLCEGDVSDSQMAEGFDIKKISIFREAKVNIARWLQGVGTYACFH